ncbi:MAG: hypothetical protein AAGH65_08910 [Pseudomonadota bacterium]
MNTPIRSFGLRWPLVRTVALLSLIFAPVVWAQSTDQAADDAVAEAMVDPNLQTQNAAVLKGERPDPAGTATEVRIDVLVLDLDAINDAQQRFNIDLYVTASWRDERLAATEPTGANRVMDVEDVWSPRVLLFNNRTLTPHLPAIVNVDDDGHVRYQQRYNGELAAQFDFSEFPFDRQVLPIDIVSYEYTPDQLVFSPDSSIRKIHEGSLLEGWLLTLEPPAYNTPITDAIQQPARITFVLDAERDSRYHLFTMYLPMTLIVFMAWTVFWLQPEMVPPRIGISTAAIFSLIAFGFSIRMSLPEVAYFTRADLFVIGTTLMVFMALAVAVIGSRWANADRMEGALRLNAWMRWVYALVFFALLLYSIWG